MILRRGDKVRNLVLKSDLMMMEIFYRGYRVFLEVLMECF